MEKVLKDRPPIEKISHNLVRSVGIKIKKTMGGIKFVYRAEIVSELNQLGFSIDILKVRGGEMPLPLLHKHVDEQAAQEAYWSAQAEKARYELSVAQDEFDYWFESKYARHFGELQDRGVPKPTEKEVNARISAKCQGSLRKKKAHIRKLETRYRLLHNACYASIVTKGKMLQTLRNIIQGGTVRAPSIEVENLGEADLTNLRGGG